MNNVKSITIRAVANGFVCTVTTTIQKTQPAADGDPAYDYMDYQNTDYVFTTAGEVGNFVAGELGEATDA